MLHALKLLPNAACHTTSCETANCRMPCSTRQWQLLSSLNSPTMMLLPTFIVHRVRFCVPAYKDAQPYVELQVVSQVVALGLLALNGRKANSMPSWAMLTSDSGIGSCGLGAC